MSSSTCTPFTKELERLEKLIAQEEPYELVGVRFDANEEMIEKAYQRLFGRIQELVHDHSPAPEQLESLQTIFTKITEAYNQIKEKSKDTPSLATRQSKESMKERYERCNASDCKRAQSLFNLGRDNIVKGNLQAAKTQIKQAITYHPHELKYKNILREIEKKLQNKKKK